MCQKLQELIDYNASDWLEEGKKMGKAEGVKSVALNLYHNGNDLGFIADMTNVSVSQVQEWVGAPMA